MCITSLGICNKLYYDEGQQYCFFVALLLLPSLLFVLVLGYHVNGVIKSAKAEHHHFLHEGTFTGWFVFVINFNITLLPLAH